MLCYSFLTNSFSMQNSLNRYFEKLGATINSFVPCVQE
jgi:hypothetical protein